jgi:hypothetical protein
MASFAFAQDEEIREYRVKEGDTLWSISDRDLQDPFLWPKIWKENPEIKNPDRIYPNQIIKIPLYLIRKDEMIEEAIAVQPPVPAPATVEEPKPAVKVTPPLVHPNIYTASGFVGDLPSYSGMIDGHAGGRVLFGNNDLVYITIRSDAKIGDRFYVYHRGHKVMHPKTGAMMGYVMEPVGILEIKKFEFGEVVAEILQCFSEVLIGDLLVPYYDMKTPVVEQPFRRPDINGFVIATKHLNEMSGPADILYIDRGERDGLQPGDIIATVAEVDRHKIPNGLLQVVSTKEDVRQADSSRQFPG